MHCFLCKQKFNSIGILVYHFKKVHSLNSNSIFRCYDRDCSLPFTNLSSYKRHLIKLHGASNRKCDDASINREINVNNKHDIFENALSFGSFETDNSETTENEFCLEKELDILKDKALKFSLSLHANDSFSRNDVYHIQKIVINLIIDPILSVFKQFSKSKISETNILNEFLSVLSNCKNPFESFDSDYLLSKKLKTSGHMPELKEFTICSELETTLNKGELKIDAKNTKGILLPLRTQMQMLFQHDNLLLDMLEYMDRLHKSSRYVNFIKGELWEKKSKMYPNKCLVPYFLYADDFEINNALGSHAGTHSICNFYYSFPCMPYNDSKMENIFLAAVIKSKDIKIHGTEKCLGTLVNELKFLEEEGVDIWTSDGKLYHVHFILGLILGDNLGLNNLLGFNKSFNGMFCRFCRLEKEGCRKECEEQQNKMRNVLNYNLDVQEGNPSESGIANECCFNSIPSFHAVDNFSVDVMHDIFEGVCHYDICDIILHFINVKKYFSLEKLNSRKKNFEYGPTEIDNISNEITITHLKKQHLRMSAREMMSFIMYFPLMVGDLIPFDDEIWGFLLKLVEIIDLVLSFEVTDVSISTLKTRIKEHNNQYILYFKKPLKPKFHILTHYPTVLQKSGPLRKFWCFKYEAKHKYFKLYSHAITSRKNICLTLAVKFQLKFANRFINDNYIANNVIFHKKDKINCDLSSLVSSMIHISQDKLSYYKQIEYFGVKYSNGYYVSKFSNDYFIYVIKNIVKYEDNFAIFAQKILNCCYQPHYTSFEVNPDSLGELVILKFDDLVGPPTTIIKTSKGKHILRLKEYYIP